MPQLSSISVGAILGLLRQGWRPIYEHGEVVRLARGIAAHRGEVMLGDSVELSGDDPARRVEISALHIIAPPVLQSELIREVARAAGPSGTPS